MIGLNGTVHVGSADGYFYRLNAADGVQQWRVKLNATGLFTGGEPIEATAAIGENGWIYVGTRHASVPGGTSFSHVYAIDPIRLTGNPDDAVEKIVWNTIQLSSRSPGILAGIVVDTCGVVYSTEFYSDTLFAWDGTSGASKFVIILDGKPCQAPGLNSNGMLYLGTSRDDEGGTRAVHGIKVSPSQDINLDWVATQFTAGRAHRECSATSTGACWCGPMAPAPLMWQTPVPTPQGANLSVHDHRALTLFARRSWFRERVCGRCARASRRQFKWPARLPFLQLAPRMVWRVMERRNAQRCRRHWGSDCARLSVRRQPGRTNRRVQVLRFQSAHLAKRLRRRESRTAAFAARSEQR
jgi:hypothetical protein